VVVLTILILSSSFIVNAAPQSSSGRGKGVCQLLDSEGNLVGSISFNFRVSDKTHPKRGPLYGSIIFEMDTDNDGVIDTIISLTEIFAIDFGYRLVQDWNYGPQCVFNGTAEITTINSEAIDYKEITVKLHDKESQDDFDRIDLEMDSETYNIGDIISGNISIKLPRFNPNR
jgi:hypothetical protein